MSDTLDKKGKYKEIWNTLIKFLHGQIDKDFSINDMINTLEVFSLGSRDNLDIAPMFSDENKRIIDEVVWDLLREGIIVPKIGKIDQSNPCISLDTFFVHQNLINRRYCL